MKKTFSRQLTLTLSLLLVTMLVLSLALQAVFFRYAKRTICDDLTQTAQATAYVTRQMTEVDADDSWLVLQFLMSFVQSTNGEDILLCDRSGMVMLCSDGPQQCRHLGCSFSPIEQMQQEAYAAQQATALYGEPRLAVCVPAYTASGELLCYVIATCDYGEVRSLMVNTLRVNLIVLAVMLPITVALVYWMMRRQTRPMKALAEAARRLGRGQTDVRVPTGGGNSEEMDELAIAFNNMASALSAAELRRQEFVANVSHELKTPMTTISGYMDGMLDGTIPEDQHRRYMSVISGEVKRLSRLVRSMLEVSRLQSSGIPREKMKTFDICEMMGLALITFEQKINGKQINVEVDFPEQGAQALGDPDSITQVVYNLIDNAVKFCEQGGTLGLSVQTARSGKYLIAIRNTGPTIPAEELPLVFDRFHKTDKSRSVDRDGVGLGLYIVKTIICSHEEDIFVTSRDGVTEFSFTLRRAPVDTMADTLHELPPEEADEAPTAGE